LVAQENERDADFFRATLTPRIRLQIYVMMGLSDPKHLDRTQSAKVADILRAMGYEPSLRADGHAVFPPWMYDAVIDIGLKLYRMEIPLFIREKATVAKVGHGPKGKPVFKRIPGKAGLLFTRILAECGFYYEDEEGQPIDLDEIPKDKLIKYEAMIPTPPDKDGKSVMAKGRPVYAIPMTDDQGNVIKNNDGTPRRRMANGIWWDWQSRIRRLTEDRPTSWVFYRDAVAILRRYLKKPASFVVIEKTLFWKGKSPLIEMSYDKLVAHLGIKAKDRRQVEAAIAAAFADALTEGIIDKPVTIRPSGYYQPTPKTNRPRRVDQVYQWKRAAKWQPAGSLPSVADDNQEANSEGKTESMKDGKTDSGL